MQEKKEEDLQQALNRVFEVGIDEVGRGAIFGPVFAAAVILTEKNKLILKQFGVTDSKKLTPKKTKLLLSKILLLSFKRTKLLLVRYSLPNFTRGLIPN